MSVAKPSLSGPPNAMGDGNDPFDIFIRQAIGTDNSSVQWVHLVHPVDQPGICETCQLYLFVEGFFDMVTGLCQTFSSEKYRTGIGSDDV
ncbi:hypothetical protein Leryth_009863 [Lithospermum erythrorhizon]|nr:hypothetical protein Leryth_009863 [Lithospermum erythrorhizon]